MSDQQQILVEDAPQTTLDSSFVPTSLPKRLIICCDGTWQSSVSGLKNVPSNVTRIARNLAHAGQDKDGKIWQQIVHYDAGIGTGDLSKSEKDRQGGFGIGFIGNVIEAYNFIVLNYAPGDQIFCFGFSRGAYTARAVAGLVNDIGIISPRDMQDFPDLYAVYQKHTDSQGFRKSQAYREWVYGVRSKDAPAGSFLPKDYDKQPHADSAEASRVVEVVGVFDTVGSLGIPDMTWTRWNLKFLEGILGVPDVGFHNVSLSPYIKHAYHALALDEHRGPFSPTLWHMPSESRRSPGPPKKSRNELFEIFEGLRLGGKASAEQLNAAWSELVDCDMYNLLQGIDSELSQVWFPGVHINIGGGSDGLLSENIEGDFEQIALISYAWMVEQAAPHISFVEDLMSLGYDTVTDRVKLIQPVLDRLDKGEKDYGTGWVSKKIWQVLDATHIHKAEFRKVALNVVNGWATGPIVDSFTGSMALAGSIPRTPAEYTKDDKGNKLGPTFEAFHPSLAFRQLKDKTYLPKPLSKFKRQLRADKQGYEWQSKELGLALPEYLIVPGDYVTRLVAKQDVSYQYGSEASQFIGGIDRQVGHKSEELEALERWEADNKGKA